MCSERQWKTASAALSQQRGEAEGSLSREVPARVASSPDNDGARRYCRTACARQARWERATKVNQWWNPRKCETGSNAADMGRAVVGAKSIHDAANLSEVMHAAGRCHEESLRRTRGEATGEKLGAAPIDRHMVNMGPVSAPPVRPRSQRGGGQAHRLLLGPRRHGAAVVLRGRESRPHGEGRQHARSLRAGMPGGCR